jgi:hypothetical protein
VGVTGRADAPYLVLDAEDRIVEVGGSAEAVYSSLLDHSLWERYADASPLFRPHYARARRIGEPVEFVQFYRGQLAWVRVVPSGDRVTLSWEVLHVLDTLTFDGLRRSMADALSLLQEWDGRIRRRRTRESLRLIEGGA